jgi:Raf kinase inhibitor-like YbhB/YbcL family protein
MRIRSSRFNDGMTIPGEFAFGVIDVEKRVAPGGNRNPHLEWHDVPEGAQSFVLICHDADVPSRLDDVNREDREVAASLPRIVFDHWVLLDVAGAAREIEAGRHSNGITPRGKPGPATSDGLRHGINDYTAWFANDADMRGVCYGYDGMCLLRNDALIHHYVFTIHALDVARLDIHGDLTGGSVRAALAGHVLAEASKGGAKLLLGGKRPDRTGYFIEPTILDNITPSNPAYYQEFFAPVAMIFRVKNDDEVVQLANDSPYGLGGSIITKDVERGKRIARQIDTGMVFINQACWTAPDLPFGGVKNSGYGRELSDLGIGEFLNKKLIRVA